RGIGWAGVKQRQSESHHSGHWIVRFELDSGSTRHHRLAALSCATPAALAALWHPPSSRRPSPEQLPARSGRTTTLLSSWNGPFVESFHGKFSSGHKCWIFKEGHCCPHFLEPTRRETEFLPFHAARKTEIKSVQRRRAEQPAAQSK